MDSMDSQNSPSTSSQSSQTQLAVKVSSLHLVSPTQKLRNEPEAQKVHKSGCHSRRDAPIEAMLRPVGLHRRRTKPQFGEVGDEVEVAASHQRQRQQPP
ncbi:hypothetical protein BDN70DRAFT_887154 [Pholiota conissans]|uniref:Uncharacterized protein n=1 Tax=Pholiota conissans TaxID=109636 RepID=A0A9P6CSP7_9AGAR|nr:hypothetical protein BDN70DRAFT_887154 [Pholiota conissans]